MEITASSFYHLLPEILSRLSDCCFVALDLEFSGVPISPRKSNEIQSLQERYEELKQCAEKYQVLQVGLTIGHEDVEKGQYILRPYNLYLNPIVDSGLGLQRDFTLQSNGGWSKPPACLEADRPSNALPLQAEFLHEFCFRPGSRLSLARGSQSSRSRSRAKGWPSRDPSNTEGRQQLSGIHLVFENSASSGEPMGWS